MNESHDPAEHAVALELLRAQVISCRAQIATDVRARQRAEAVLQRYLEALFPHLFPQALAQQLSVVEAAEYFFEHHLHGHDPLQLFGPAEPQVEPAPQTAVDPGIKLSGDAAKFLYAAGLRVLAPEIKAMWAQHAGKSPGTARNTVLPELLDRGVLQVEKIPVPRYLTQYASDTCYLLTEAGRAEYRRRFSAEAVSYADAYAPHKSPEAWWLVRATAGLIRAGNDVASNTRFAYTVYDPTGEPDAAAEAGFERRYGHSEPDLIVVVAAQHGGATTRLAIECERGTYSGSRLKQKLLKNLHDYGAAGFDGVYYVANNQATARKLASALGKTRAEIKAQPNALTGRSFLALFTLGALQNTWLPTPRLIDAEFFDRRARQVNAHWPADATKPERYFKYTPPTPSPSAKGAHDDA